MKWRPSSPIERKTHAAIVRKIPAERVELLLRLRHAQSLGEVERIKKELDELALVERRLALA